MERCAIRRIACFLCVLIFALPAMSEVQKVQQTWICDSCNYENLYMGRFCEECGAARTSGEWKCAVCGKINDRNFCEDCGAGRDAIGSTSEPTTVPTSVPTPEPVHEMKNDTPYKSEDSLHLKVFGTSMERRNVRSITLLSSLQDAPSNAIDVSKAGDGSVLLWFESDGSDKSDMFLAANGRITAPENCDALFSYYMYCERIHLNNCLYTSQTTNMAHMFSCCWNLLELDGISFETLQVANMEFMFSHCDELEKLDLSSFNTAAVKDFAAMFSNCKKLKDLNIASFELTSDANTHLMFDNCDALPASAYTHIAHRLQTPTPKPTATIKPTATPYVYYPQLSRGSSNIEVWELQTRLVELGYLAEGEADGSYGRRTAEAVHRFKQSNDISDSSNHFATECVATSEMQSALFSKSAKAFVEPDFPLTFPYGSYAEWSKENGNKLKIHFQVTNISSWRTAIAFKIEVYATDVWGNEIYGNNVYYETTKREIAPSDYGWSAYLYLPNCSEIDQVYARISEVKLSDGTTLKNSDSDYSNWSISWKG